MKLIHVVDTFELGLELELDRANLLMSAKILHVVVKLDVVM